jgi:hypothetical protein
MAHYSPFFLLANPALCFDSCSETISKVVSEHVASNPVNYTRPLVEAEFFILVQIQFLILCCK